MHLPCVARSTGEDTELNLEQSSTGIVVADAVKLVRDNSADTDNEIGQSPGLRHRLGARAEDRIRTARSTGLGNL
ncbi:hypothetical protein ACWDU0_22100 [Streptomyces cellulosae]